MRWKTLPVYDVASAGLERRAVYDAIDRRGYRVGKVSVSPSSSETPRTGGAC